MDRTTARGAWPDPERVERLLAGAPADPRDPGDIRFTAVVRLLAAESGPAARPDPGREAAAVTAFRVARDRRQGSVRSARALAGGLVAVFTLGGFAVVASGLGVLPAPFRGGVHAGPLPTETDAGGETGTAITSETGTDAGPATETATAAETATKTATETPRDTESGSVGADTVHPPARPASRGTRLPGHRRERLAVVGPAAPTRTHRPRGAAAEPGKRP